MRGPRTMGATANGLSCQFCCLCCFDCVLVSRENSRQPSNGTVAVIVLPSGNRTLNLSPRFRLLAGTLMVWTRGVGGCGGDVCCFDGCGCGGIWTRMADPAGHPFGTTAEICLPSGTRTRIRRSGGRIFGTITFTVAASFCCAFFFA